MQAVSYNTFCLKKKQLMMDQQSLPTSFEVVVVGTGLEESVVAAAAARVGHTVLHVDPNDYYGDAWAAFSFEGIQEWAERQEGSCGGSAGSAPPEAGEVTQAEGLLKEGEKLVRLKEGKSLFRNVRQKFNVTEEEKDEEAEEGDSAEKTDEAASGDAAQKGEEAEPVSAPLPTAPPPPPSSKPERTRWTKKRLLEHSRRFNLDLTPRLLFSRGSMVELLISSNIARYTEFKSVSRVLTVVNDSDGGGRPRLEHVPSSRADVFATRRVSVVEKRILMKFLSFCAAVEEKDEAGGGEEQDGDHSGAPSIVDSFADRPFREFLRHQKLTDNLSHFVVHSIAMVSDDATTREGLTATRKFLSSLGRFGNTPFLWSMYGAGELPQAFCRLSAVFGGTYFLGRSVEAVAVKDGMVSAIVSGGSRIECDKLVLPAGLCRESAELAEVEELRSVSRRIHLLSDSVLPSEKEQLSFVSFPCRSSYAYVQEVGFGAAACPRGMYCLQVTAGGGEEDGGRDADVVIEGLLGDENRPLWSLSYEMEVVKAKEGSSKVENVFACDGPGFELDYDAAIANARRTFERMFPGEEFLPRAPEPEEIIIGGGDAEEDTKEDEGEKKDEPAEGEVKAEDGDAKKDGSTDDSPEESKD